VGAACSTCSGVGWRAPEFTEPCGECQDVLDARVGKARMIDGVRAGKYADQELGPFRPAPALRQGLSIESVDGGRISEGEGAPASAYFAPDQIERAAQMERRGEG
jgi:hypothetical protein